MWSLLQCILSRLCLPPSVGGDQGGSLWVDANIWDCLKIQRNTKETKANTRVPGESGSVRLTRDGRGATVTANAASARSDSRMREHACLDHGKETCRQTWLCVHSCTSKARAHPSGGGRPGMGPGPEKRSWAKARRVAAVPRPCACLPRVSRPAPGLPPAVTFTVCFYLDWQARPPINGEPRRKPPGLGLPDPISGVSGCDTSWPFLPAPVAPG